MVDYTSKNNNVFASISYLPAANMTFSGTVNYNKATGELDEFTLNYEDKLRGDLTHSDYTFEETPSYSDIDYALISFTLGMEYRFTPSVTFTADMDYADLKDEAGSVYGDESGSFFMIRSGVRLDF